MYFFNSVRVFRGKGLPWLYFDLVVGIPSIWLYMYLITRKWITCVETKPLVSYIVDLFCFSSLSVELLWP